VHKYQEANPDFVRINTIRRRVRLLNADGDFTAEQWVRMKQACEFRCLCCGRREPEITLSMDHVVPLIQGGPHCEANIQPICRECNSRKHTQIIDYRERTIPDA
jgi:5-methylcytosine-specific restriction endonuclease McrA